VHARLADVDVIVTSLVELDRDRRRERVIEAA
jgi:hypothetical protein